MPQVVEEMRLPQFEAPLDSGILQPHQLSDHECEILLQIEDRLREVERQSKPLQDQSRHHDRRDSDMTEFTAEALAYAEERYQRVLLLDGARGTGKTSFVLTLINRWHDAGGIATAKPWELNAAQAHRASISAGVATTDPPKNIRVLRNLDFDPLPPRVPVLAGIVQAWRPLAELYDRETFDGDDGCEDTGRRGLMDSWHSLFRLAATGWSDLPRSKGLIEQVLDREEQVKDWQDLREYWLWFVGEVIRIGRCLKSKHQLNGDPVFVIVIDDVDLQVERVRELLPALRLLTHPNVFFLVAAHGLHMIDMLKFDFFGQQHRLAGSSSSQVLDSKKDEWSSVLAQAAFEKAFPIRNRWTLERLTLSEVLDYPPAAGLFPPTSGDAMLVRRTLGSVLNQIRRKPNPHNTSKRDDERSSKAGDAVARLAEAARNASVPLPTLSYRSIQQMWQTVSDGAAVGNSQTAERAATVLARLVSPDPVMPAQVLRDEEHTIFVPTIGQLAALFHPSAIDPGGSDNVVVSARPEFLYVLPDRAISTMSGGASRFDFTAGLIASTLQELNFPVSTAMGWDVRLAFAWTEWPRLDATFGWPWHTHPRPDELLEQTKSWAEYLKTVGAVAEKKRIRERHAYAWVYYECERYFGRLGRNISSPNPTSLARKIDLPWETLIASLRTSQRTRNDELKRWTQYTLPLLARPEIALDRETQYKLLTWSALDAAVVTELRKQRRRMATDAVVVASLRRGTARGEPTDEEVDALLDRIEGHHKEAYGRPSPWSELVESNHERKGQEGARGQARTSRRAGS